MSTQDEPHFDSYARSYDELHQASIRSSGEDPEYFAAYKADHIARSLGHAFSSAQGLSVLDFGCGIGNSIPHLTRIFPNARVLGTDVSSESIALAREKNPDAELQVLSGNTIPLPDHSVDVVTAACVYHHIPPAQRQAWTAEIRRILKPGGHFFMFEHNPVNPLTQWVVKNCEFDDDAILLSRRESISLLAAAGLRNASATYIVFFPKFASPLRTLERHLGWLPLGAQYVAHARA